MKAVWERARAQQFNARPPVHCSSESLQPVDLPFGFAVAPNGSHRIANCGNIAFDRAGTRNSWSFLRCLAHSASTFSKVGSSGGPVGGRAIAYGITKRTSRGPVYPDKRSADPQFRARSGKATWIPGGILPAHTIHQSRHTGLRVPLRGPGETEPQAIRAKSHMRSLWVGQNVLKHWKRGKSHQLAVKAEFSVRHFAGNQR